MSITFTREELYDGVWAEPIDTLCKEFGLSNVGLGKACVATAPQRSDETKRRYNSSSAGFACVLILLLLVRSRDRAI